MSKKVNKMPYGTEVIKIKVTDTYNITNEEGSKGIAEVEFDAGVFDSPVEEGDEWFCYKDSPKGIIVGKSINVDQVLEIIKEINGKGDASYIGSASFPSYRPEKKTSQYSTVESKDFKIRCSNMWWEYFAEEFVKLLSNNPINSTSNVFINPPVIQTNTPNRSRRRPNTCGFCGCYNNQDINGEKRILFRYDHNLEEGDFDFQICDVCHSRLVGIIDRRVHSLKKYVTKDCITYKTATIVILLIMIFIGLGVFGPSLLSLLTN